MARAARLADALRGLRSRARALRAETHALYLACRDHRTPWLARAVAACVVAYALSPLDLIPDVVPVLGYLDDVVLVPLGLALALRLIPPEVMADSRRRAAASAARPGQDWRAAVVVVAIWLVVALAAAAGLFRLLA